MPRLEGSSIWNQLFAAGNHYGDIFRKHVLHVLERYGKMLLKVYLERMRKLIPPKLLKQLGFNELVSFITILPVQSSHWKSENLTR